MEKNASIQCVVNECKYHYGKSDHCTLEQIKVGKSEAVINKAVDTDCTSFSAKEDKMY